MSLDLQEPLSRYFAAQTAHDIDAMLSAFAHDASVKDEGQDLRGLAAIRAWMIESDRKYRPTATPTGVELSGGITIVKARVAGTFPDSPIELRYRFKIVSEKISNLEIGT